MCELHRFSLGDTKLSTHSWILIEDFGYEEFENHFFSIKQSGLQKRIKSNIAIHETICTCIREQNICTCSLKSVDKSLWTMYCNTKHVFFLKN